VSSFKPRVVVRGDIQNARTSRAHGQKSPDTADRPHSAQSAEAPGSTVPPAVESNKRIKCLRPGLIEPPERMRLLFVGLAQATWSRKSLRQRPIPWCQPSEYMARLGRYIDTSACVWANNPSWARVSRRLLGNENRLNQM